MSDEERLAELLVRWEDDYDRGGDPSLEELCRDTPHLAGRVAKEIARLKSLRSTADGDTPIPPPSQPMGPPPPPTKAFAGLRFAPRRHHASGGLGDVFVAVDQEVGREVALKRMQPRHADDSGCRARFEREAEITGRLEHPGVVPLYGRGRDADGRPFYAMRFIRGRSLRAAIKDFYQPENAKKESGARAVAFRGLLQSFVGACHTVAYAHSRGVIHRDLKPDNIMLGPYGETLVVDWGLAKYVGRDEPTCDAAEESVRPAALPDGEGTRTGAVVGTPAFMSPEQALGRKDVGPAGDVFSLGATLFQMLTGRPPYQGAMALVDAAAGNYPRPRQVRRDAPRSLEAVCLKALALRPEDRYATAQDLARDVDRWLAEEPTAAYREPWRARVWRWVKRRRTLAAATAAAVLVALATGLAILFLWQRSDLLRRQEQEQARQKAVNDLCNVAEDQLREDRYGDAAVTLGKAVPLLQGRPDLTEGLQRLEARRNLFARLDEFLRSADQAWFFAGEERGAKARAACEQALAYYDVLERPDWRTQGPAAAMPRETAALVQREVHRLLLLAAAMHIQQGILSYTRLQFEEVKPHADRALEAVARARDMEKQGVVEPSRATAILEKGARDLPGLGLLSGLMPGAPAERPGACLPDDLSAEDGFFLGVMHVYLAKHQSDPVARVVRLLGPREFDYDHPRDTAVEMLRRAVRKEPRQYWTCWMLGRILAFPGPDHKADNDEAVLAFTNCIALRPDYSRGYEQRGLTLANLAAETRDETRRQGLLELVNEDFRKANDLAPDDPSMWWVRGQMLQRLHQAPEALAAYTHALDLMTNLQDKISLRNQLEEPRRLVEEALQKNPNDPDALRLAERLAHAGRP